MEKFTKEQKKFLMSVIDSKISERTGDYYNNRYVKAGLEQAREIVESLSVFNDDGNGNDDEMIKIILSVHHGAGFSSCNSDFEGIEKDTDIIAFLENQDVPSAIGVCEKKYPGAYAEGLYNCIVTKIPKGTIYRISAYDGLEALKTLDTEVKWKLA